eukprot:6965396-Pyramimonas_sp.AAC.1
MTAPSPAHEMSIRGASAWSSLMSHCASPPRVLGLTVRSSRRGHPSSCTCSRASRIQPAICISHSTSASGCPGKKDRCGNDACPEPSRTNRGAW